LAFVEDGRARVVGARLVRVSELLATGLMDAFLCHGSDREVWCEERREIKAVVKLCECEIGKVSRKEIVATFLRPTKYTGNTTSSISPLGALLGACEIAASGFAFILLSTCP
jgi:hypothetical protein